MTRTLRTVTPRADWSQKKRATALALRKEGYSYRQIAEKIDRSMTPSGIRKLCERFKVTGSIKNQPGRNHQLSAG